VGRLQIKLETVSIITVLDHSFPPLAR